MSETLTTVDQSLIKGTGIAKESVHCNNGGCTRPVYRAHVCFRCWAGTKWTSMWQRIQNKNGHNPSYEKIPLQITKQELIGWILNNPPSSDLERPSIDRIDNSKGYSLTNIRWLEHRINSKGCQRDIPEGFKKCSGCQKVLSLEAFSPNRSLCGVQRQSKCRSCKLVYDRAWRASYVRH